MDREPLAALLAEGLSLQRIADRVGRSPSTVSYHLRRHGLTANGASQYGQRSPLDRASLAALVAEGLAVPEIASRLDRTPAVVRRALLRHGLRTRQERNRQMVREALAEGRRVVALECGRHGHTDHVLEGRGGYRCMRCRGAQVSAHRRRIKRVLISEAGGACVVCGYDRCEAALQFHHLDPTAKVFHLSLRGVTRSWAQVRAEAAKCALLCATCHAEVEAGFTRLPNDPDGLTVTPRGGLEPPNLD